ncbi:MAG: hypothetical protein EA412_11950 [Chitinophagaceae bacterium]|nr:MAG: hypothetical protein EA412_11950 [Chitinophagaceae bacterium]
MQPRDFNAVYAGEKLKFSVKTSTMQNKTSTTIKNYWIINLTIVSILILLLQLFFINPLTANTYTANFNGNYSDRTIWLPSYPGNVIGKNDTIIINKNVQLNTDVVVHGTLIVKDKSSLRGTNSLVVTEEGVVENKGILISRNINNQGLVRNNNILETSNDLINTGIMVNFESMIVGNIFENKGMISGNGGHMLVNRQLINYMEGQIGGNIDICSNDFRNVEGGSIDSTYLSFCGNRIYNGAFLTANLEREKVILNLLNTEDSRYEEYQIERSTDGKNFAQIANIEGDEINDFALAFKYTDRDPGASPILYYRVILKRGQQERVVPVIEVNNIFGIQTSSRIN